jgi:hypothetical protein
MKINEIITEADPAQPTFGQAASQVGSGLKQMGQAAVRGTQNFINKPRRNAPPGPVSNAISGATKAWQAGVNKSGQNLAVNDPVSTAPKPVVIKGEDGKDYAFTRVSGQWVNAQGQQANPADVPKIDAAEQAAEEQQATQLNATQPAGAWSSVAPQPQQGATPQPARSPGQTAAGAASANSRGFDIGGTNGAPAQPTEVPQGQQLVIKTPQGQYTKTQRGWINGAGQTITKPTSIDYLEKFADSGAGRMEQIPPPPEPVQPRPLGRRGASRGR